LEEEEELTGDQASTHPSQLQGQNPQQHGMMQVLPACLPNMFAVNKAA
jgi:hypothetical protein